MAIENQHFLSVKHLWNTSSLKLNPRVLKDDRAFE